MSSARRHHWPLWVCCVAFLCCALVWTLRPPGVFRRRPVAPAVEMTEEEFLVRRWAAAVERKDRLETMRAESEMVRRGERVVPLLARVADGSPDLTGEVVRVLGRIRCVASVSTLQGLHRHQSASGGAALRSAILRSLAEIGGQNAREAFLALLADEPDAGVRRVALDLAGALLRPEDLAALSPDLRPAASVSLSHREETATLLADLSATPAASRASHEWAAYLSPTYPLAARSIAIERLETRADEEALDSLRKAVAEGDVDTSIGAFAALCRLRSNAARVAVRDLLHATPEERLPAMLDVLGTYGDQAYLPLARQVEEASASEPLKAHARRAALRLEIK